MSKITDINYDDINIKMDEITTELSDDSLATLIKLQETQFSNDYWNPEDPNWKDKFSQLRHITDIIKSKDVISMEDFEFLRQHAISKGGFLTSEFRREIWKKIFCVDKQEDQYKFVFINEKNASTNSDIEGIDAKYDPFIERSEPLGLKLRNCYSGIIDADVKRSKINSLYRADLGFNDTNLSLKKKLKLFINTMSSINEQNYQYFQGYHDIGLFFLFLYLQDYTTGVAVFQRFSEFILKESLLVHDKNGKGFSFKNSLEILMELINILDPQVKDIIESECYGQPTFAIAWLLTLFTHSIENNALQYRLLDYLIVSHPIAIFHLVAHLAVDEIQKLMLFYKNTFNDGDIFMHFQSLDVDSIDYEKYILESEDSMKCIPVKRIMDRLKDAEFESYYPLINEESYTKKLIIKKNNEKRVQLWKYAMMGSLTFMSAILIGVIAKKKYGG